MIAYATVGTNDMDRAIRFYDAALAPLGCERATTSPTWTGYRRKGEPAWLFLTAPYDGGAASHGNGTMMAFLAPSREAVQAFHIAGLAHGGQDEGAAGERPGMDPVFYGAYVRDPDGNKLCAFTRG
jgi:catechol 2,3-dioxygenase-like lactoylglutathione lyase family enzyme